MITIASVLGSTLAVWILSLIWKWVFRRFLGEPQLTLVSVLASYVVACVLSAFGSSNDGVIDWTVGLVKYGIGAVIVIAVMLMLNRKKQEGGHG